MVLIDVTYGLAVPIRWMGLPSTPLRLAAAAVAAAATVVHGLRHRARSRP